MQRNVIGPLAIAVLGGVVFMSGPCWAADASKNALANPQDVNQATEDVLKQQLIAVRWGWSQRMESDLLASLSDVTIKLRDGLVPALRLDNVAKSGKTMYLLVPDELYGQGVKMLPQ